MVDKSKRVRNLARSIDFGLGEPYKTELYNCLRTAVYGLPGSSAVQAKDLVHELAKIMDKPDPSSAAD